MSEDNVRRQMPQPWIKFSTDAGGVDPAHLGERGLLHPRAFGTYTRVLGHYVRDEGVLPLEDAIRKMTSAVADRLFLRDRGLLRAGMKADVVVFDPEDCGGSRHVRPSPSTFDWRARRLGQRRARAHDGDHTGATPGRRVHGPGYVRN